MTAIALLTKNRERILSIAARHGARDVRVFGSALRGEARPDLRVGCVLMHLFVRTGGGV